MSQPLDYKELLKKYIEVVYLAIDNREFDGISFDINTDDYLSEEQKTAICTLISEVEND